MYAILRTAKIKTLGNLEASAQHMTRERDTPNADPARKQYNFALIGGSDPAADVLANLPAERRKNGVLAIEVLLTASPEWFVQADDSQKRAWVKISQAWLKRHFGPANVVSLMLHQDETTPHLTGFIVPRDPETGRLNARRWLGGAAKLAAMQTEYAREVAPLGLRRGLEGSKSQHTPVQQFYGAINSPAPVIVPEIEIATPGTLLTQKQKDEYAKAQTEAVTQAIAPAFDQLAMLAKTADLDRRAKKAADRKAAKAVTDAKVAQEELEQVKAGLEAAKTELQKLRARVRDLDLAQVLPALGLKARKQGEQTFYADPEGRFSIGIDETGRKWKDHVSGKGRSSTIDAVMHVLGTEAGGATAWLADRFGDMGAMAAARHKGAAEAATAIASRAPFTPPGPDEQHWPAVRAHLVDALKLDSGSIDFAKRNGSIYADGQRRAVFLMRDPQKPTRITGAELLEIGTTTPRLALGSNREKGAFYLTIKTVAEAIEREAAVICENAVEALSFLTGFKKNMTHSTVISTAGARLKAPTFMAYLKAAKRFITYPDDEIGQKALVGWRADDVPCERTKPGTLRTWLAWMQQKITQQATQAQPARRPPDRGRGGAGIGD